MLHVAYGKLPGRRGALAKHVPSALLGGITSLPDEDHQAKHICSSSAHANHLTLSCTPSSTLHNAFHVQRPLPPYVSSLLVAACEALCQVKLWLLGSHPRSKTSNVVWATQCRLSARIRSHSAAATTTLTERTASTNGSRYHMQVRSIRLSNQDPHTRQPWSTERHVRSM